MGINCGAKIGKCGYWIEYASDYTSALENDCYRTLVSLINQYRTSHDRILISLSHFSTNKHSSPGDLMVTLTGKGSPEPK